MTLDFVTNVTKLIIQSTTKRKSVEQTVAFVLVVGVTIGKSKGVKWKSESWQCQSFYRYFINERVAGTRKGRNSATIYISDS